MRDPAQQEVIQFLKHTPLASLPEIIIETGLSKELACDAVVRLHEEGFVICRPGPRRPVYQLENDHALER
jgi:hypothetical protein